MTVADLIAGESVLDVACGSGRHVRWLAGQHGRGLDSRSAGCGRCGYAVGVDIAEAMVDAAAHR